MLIFVDFFQKTFIMEIRMDIICEKPIPYREILRLISGKRVIVGAKQLRKALLSDKAGCVYLACDADPAVTEPIVTLCRLHNVKAFFVQTMAELGKACGIDVGAAAAATAKENGF